MKTTITVNSQQEFDALIQNGKVVIKGNLHITFMNCITDADIDVDGFLIALGLSARDVCAMQILADYLDVRDITYYGECIAEKSFVCRSIQGNRAKNNLHKCLDQEIVYKK